MRFTTGRGSTYRRQKVLLAVGFVLTAIAVYVARGSPATGYEVSLYRGTPTAVWVATAAALFVAGLVALRARRKRVLGGAIGLAATVVSTIAALPILRGYHFYGFNDSLTHLGFVRAIVAGADPLTSIYPATHVTSVVLAEVGGATDTHAMQLTFLLFALGYLVFVPALTYRLVPDIRVVTIAAFAGFLFLPVNPNGFKFLFFPFSMSAFLTPLLLYLLVCHATTGDESTRPTDWWSVGAQFGTRSALLFVLVAVGATLAHPLAAFDMLVFCAGIGLAKWVFSWRWNTVREARLRPFSGIVVTFGVVLSAWAIRFEAFYHTANDLLVSVASFVGGEAGAMQAVSQRAGSANSVGVSIVELFAKLFLVDAVFVGVAVSLVGVLLAKRLGLVDHRFGVGDRDGETISLYFGVAMLWFLPYAAIHLLGMISEMNFFFRHQGFLLIPATVLGSIGLASIGRFLASRWSSATVTRTGAVLAAVALTLSLSMVFPSPFVYLPSNHVTEQQMSGYATTFERGGDVPLVTIRGVGDRYATSVGIEDPGPFDGDLAVSGATGPDRLVDPNETVHFPVTEVATKREAVAYRGLRYSRAYLESFSDRPGTDRVVSNGEFALYHLRSGDLASESEP